MNSCSTRFVRRDLTLMFAYSSCRRSVICTVDHPLMLITMTTSMSRSEEQKEVGEWRPSRSGEGTRCHKYVFFYAKLRGRNDDKREGRNDHKREGRNAHKREARDDHKRDDKLFHVISTLFSLAAHISIPFSFNLSN